MMRALVTTKHLIGEQFVLLAFEIARAVRAHPTARCALAVLSSCKRDLRYDAARRTR
jgi:hypothetical protein